MMRILAWLEIRFPGIARYWTGDSILWVGAARDRWGYWHFIPWTGCHEYQKQHSFSRPVLLLGKLPNGHTISKANSGHPLAWFTPAKPCTIQAKYATAQNEVTGLEAFRGTGYSNYLVSIPSIWLPGRFIALPFHRKRLPPAPCGTIISVDWMNEQKRCEPRESGRDGCEIPSLVSFAHIYHVLTLLLECTPYALRDCKMRTKGSIEDPIRE